MISTIDGEWVLEPDGWHRIAMPLQGEQEHWLDLELEWHLEEESSDPDPCIYQEPKRARRIRHRERKKQRARQIVMREWRWFEYLRPRAQDWREEYITKNYNHMARCSCPGCGNPRRWFGELTRQERKAAMGASQQLGEWEAESGRKPFVASGFYYNRRARD